MFSLERYRECVSIRTGNPFGWQHSHHGHAPSLGGRARSENPELNLNLISFTATPPISPSAPPHGLLFGDLFRIKGEYTTRLEEEGRRGNGREWGRRTPPLSKSKIPLHHLKPTFSFSLLFLSFFVHHVFTYIHTGCNQHMQSRCNVHADLAFYFPLQTFHHTHIHTHFSFFSHIFVTVAGQIRSTAFFLARVFAFSTFTTVITFQFHFWRSATFALFAFLTAPSGRIEVIKRVMTNLQTFQWCKNYISPPPDEMTFSVFSSICQHGYISQIQGTEIQLLSHLLLVLQIYQTGGTSHIHFSKEVFSWEDI